jgi:hypothetical protein
MEALGYMSKVSDPDLLTLNPRPQVLNPKLKAQTLDPYL